MEYIYIRKAPLEKKQQKKGDIVTLGGRGVNLSTLF